jgi:hypothetical protein
VVGVDALGGTLHLVMPIFGAVMVISAGHPSSGPPSDTSEKMCAGPDAAHQGRDFLAFSEGRRGLFLLEPEARHCRMSAIGFLVSRKPAGGHFTNGDAPGVRLRKTEGASEADACLERWIAINLDDHAARVALDRARPADRCARGNPRSATQGGVANLVRSEA